MGPVSAQYGFAYPCPSVMERQSHAARFHKQNSQWPRPWIKKPFVHQRHDRKSYTPSSHDYLGTGFQTSETGTWIPERFLVSGNKGTIDYARAGEHTTVLST